MGDSTKDFPFNYYLSGAFTDEQLSEWVQDVKIKTEIDLDINEDEYADSLGTLIREEFDRAIKREVTSMVSGIVKGEVDKLRTHLAEQMRILTPKKLDEYLIRLSREGR